jgi:DNA-binding transcriptional MerR regulator
VAKEVSANDEGFRGPQVCKIIGITYRQLDYWARTDLLRPSLADAKGSGSQRLYSYRDLVELKVIKSLLDAGVALQSARKAIDYLRDNLGEDLASAKLVLQGSDSIVVRTDQELIDVLHRGQGVLNLVSITPLKDEVDAAIADLRPAAGGGGSAGVSKGHAQTRTG